MNQVAGVFEADLYFSGVPQPVRLIRCAPLLDAMGDVFPTWPFRMERCDPASTPIITVRHVKGEYRIDAPWLEQSVFADTDACAFSSIVVDLIYAWLEANPQALCLHCAAAEFGGRLVVFPNTNKVGKSLLVTRLMAERRTSYGDDLVALLPEGAGMSFGVPHRLRLPLPASERAVAEFIQAHRGKADTWSQYLAPNAPGLAPFRQTRPIGAFVMLNRKPAGKAELIPADAADSLQNIVYQNLMRRGSALEVLDRAQWLAKEKPCWYLRYARLDDAVALLRQAFVETDRGFSKAGHEHETALTAAVEKITPRPNRPRSRARRRASGRNYVRRPEVLIRQEQGEFFLIQATGDEIFHLNALGRAVWELLAEPLSETETVALLASVFPETSRAQIERDVIELFAAFRRKHLLLGS
ncbi:PqqD family protein [Desulfobulbus sp.]|uniref:PqqD family protein n=1 Tax=Desulfobulbus sp. TaxID=895 RepID=UPI00286F9345|nr:PqqD family protein [Desulfobulbus sp.]